MHTVGRSAMGITAAAITAAAITAAAITAAAITDPTTGISITVSTTVITATDSTVETGLQGRRSAEAGFPVAHPMVVVAGVVVVGASRSTVDKPMVRPAAG